MAWIDTSVSEKIAGNAVWFVRNSVEQSHSLKKEYV